MWRQQQIWILSLPPTMYMTLRQIANHLMPRFPDLMEVWNLTYVIRSNEFICKGPSVRYGKEGHPSTQSMLTFSLSGSMQVGLQAVLTSEDPVSLPNILRVSVCSTMNPIQYGISGLIRGQSMDIVGYFVDKLEPCSIYKVWDSDDILEKCL